MREFALYYVTSTEKHKRWGEGFRSRREVIYKSLSALGLFVNLPYHGIERQVFLSPLASNARELLRGETGVPQWCRAPMKELGEFFKERWMLPLPSWDQRYRDFDPGRLRLWEKE